VLLVLGTIEVAHSWPRDLDIAIKGSIADQDASVENGLAESIATCMQELEGLKHMVAT